MLTKNLVGTYWKLHNENTAYIVIEQLDAELYHFFDMAEGYRIKWLIDESYGTGHSIRTKIHSASSITQDIQITEDEYLIMLVE